MTYRLLLVILLAVFTSCDRGPVPDSGLMPEIVQISASSDVTSVTLTANFKNDLFSKYNCGFYYGRDGGPMQKATGNVSGKIVKANISGLTPDTESVFKAYVSNGRTETCSQFPSAGI